MTVVLFPAPKVIVQPIIEISAPRMSPSGLYEVTIWKNRDRDEGYLVRVPTHKDAMQVLRLVKQSFKGAAHG